jgi:hypothetical protein
MEVYEIVAPKPLACHASVDRLWAVVDPLGLRPGFTPKLHASALRGLYTG